MNDSKGFFPGGIVPPICPRCKVHLNGGDVVQDCPPGPNGHDKQHVDCDNPQRPTGKVGPLVRAIRKARGK